MLLQRCQVSPSTRFSRMSESLEHEHFIGFNTIPNGTLFHPNGVNYIFTNGGNLVIGDLLNAHSQEFLRRHDDYITCVALSNDGKLIATGQRGENADIFIWDFDTRRVLYKLEEHDKLVQAVAFSSDGKLLATVGGPEDGNLIVWDMSNGCIVSSAARISPGTCCAAFGGFIKDIKRRDTDHYLLCTAGSDGLVLWDLDPYSGEMFPLKLTGEARATITRQITAVTFSQDNELLYGATTSGDYVIASMKSHKIAQAVTATRMGLNAIAALDHGGVAIGCGDSTVKVFAANGDFKAQIQLDGSVVGLSLSPDRLEVLASTSFGSVARINLSTLQYILISESHTASIVKVAFDEGHGERFATACSDGTIKVWDLVEYTVITTARARKEQERGAAPLCLAFANILLSGWSDGRVLAHSAETGDNLWFIDNAHPGGVTALVLSHNHRFILTGGPQGEVRLWELRTRELISHLKEHKQRVTCLALFDDDSSGLTGSRDRCVLRWDLKTEHRTHCHMQRMGGINSVALFKDQSHILTVGQERRISVWDNRSDHAVFTTFLDGENDEGMSVAISHDGRYAATGGSAGIVRVWAVYSNPYSVKFLCESKGHSKSITSVAFSLDDKQVVSVGEDGAIFIWCLYAN